MINSDQRPPRDLYLPLFASKEPRCGTPKKLAAITCILLFMFGLIWSYTRHASILSFSGTVPTAHVTSLETRLQDLLARPILSYEDAYPLNHCACLSGTFGRDTVAYFEENLPRWKEYNSDEVRNARQQLVEHMLHLMESGVQVKWTNELLYPPYQTVEPGVPRRGIIYSASQGGQLERLKVSLSMLRHTLRSTLPVEIFHFEDEIDEETKQQMMEEFSNISFRVTKHVGGTSYSIKNQAFIETSFTQFVWMDSDTIPLVDPDALFDSTEFQQAGNVWWPDVSKDHPDNPVWRVLGQTCSDKDWTAETGQVVFDKRGNDGLNLAALYMSAYMIQHHDTWGWMSWGDKDTFRFAFYALNLDYQMAPRVLMVVGQRQRDDTGQIAAQAELCGYANMHWDLTPLSETGNPDYRSKPAFLHANVIKNHGEVWDEDFLALFRRPRMDRIDDVRLVRTPAKFAGVCLYYELFGPDDSSNVDPLGDGQGMLEAPLEDAWKDESGVVSEEDRQLVDALMTLGRRINHISKGEY